MSSIQKRGSKWQLRVIHRLLPNAFYSTFDSEADAVSYGDQLERLLKNGIVPQELVDKEKRRADPFLEELIDHYKKLAPIAPSEVETLRYIKQHLYKVRLSKVNAQWADQWVRNLKLESNLAPSTIRKRIESLARVIDWYHRTHPAQNDAQPINQLRLMPRGYSQYTKTESEQSISEGKVAKVDVERNRRLLPEEENRIRSAMAGEKRPDKERKIAHDAAFSLLFELILNTGLRLSEAFCLRCDQVDHRNFVLKIEGSKGHRGAIKHRVVPLVPSLRGELKSWCEGKEGLLFPFWNGAADEKRKAGSKLSSRFKTLFEYANVMNFVEHDLRHEATCRWFDRRDPQGRWVLSEIEICRIMGWKDTRMALRYASIRGEDLASRLV